MVKRPSGSNQTDGTRRIDGRAQISAVRRGVFRLIFTTRVYLLLEGKGRPEGRPFALRDCPRPMPVGHEVTESTDQTGGRSAWTRGNISDAAPRAGLAGTPAARLNLIHAFGR